MTHHTSPARASRQPLVGSCSYGLSLPHALQFVPEHFAFKVETCGSLAPEQIVQSALRELVRKMGEIRAMAGDLTGGGR